MNREGEERSVRSDTSSKIRYRQVTGSSKKESFIATIPTTHELVTKSRLSALEKKAKLYDDLMKTVSRSKYSGSPLGDSLLGMAASLVPQCGLHGIMIILPFCVASVLANAGMKFDIGELVTSQPSREKLLQLVGETAVDTVLLTQKSILDNPILYFSVDKGNKKGNKNLAKYICWYDKRKDAVTIFLVDVNCSDESTDEVADATVHSLKRLFPDGENIRLHGQCTDSGGGGTLHSMARAMHSRNMTSEHYLVGSCSLHNLQTCLRNAVINVLGEGGTDANGEYLMNAMQMLHGAYNLQNWHETEELKDLWKYIVEVEGENYEFQKLEEPITTRWWLVGACAASFKVSLLIWEKICKAIRNSAPSGSASSKIASCTANLIQNKVIRCDLELIIVFHTYFLFKHFKFFQRGDPEAGKTPGFISRHIMVRYFLMESDLHDIDGEKWKTHEAFRDYVKSLDEISDADKEIQNKKLTHFFRNVHESLKRHFEPWTNKLFFLSLFSKQHTATSAAKLLIGRNMENLGENGSHYCKFHKSNININEFMRWMKKHVSTEVINETRNLSFIRQHIPAISLIADGCNAWGNAPGNALASFRQLYLHRFSAFPINSQFTERGVKESGHVSLGRRNETHRSLLAISRAKIMPNALQDYRDDVKVESESESDAEDGEDDEDGEKKVKQLGGKRRAKFLMCGLFEHNTEMVAFKQSFTNEG